MTFRNAYEDGGYAASYAKLGFPGTYYLAFRDLPTIFEIHVRGTRALDFGCGTGRSTRFLKQCGFDAIGIDIAPGMLALARELDPDGDYRLATDGDYAELGEHTFDLVLSTFTFDNVPTRQIKETALRGIRRLLAPRGRFVNVVSSPELYTHEWASFSTIAFSENRDAAAGDIVRCMNIALDDHRPVEDILWPDSAYQEVYAAAGLALVETYRPLGRPHEAYPWVNEGHIPPWAIYVLRPAGAARQT